MYIKNQLSTHLYMCILTELTDKVPIANVARDALQSNLLGVIVKHSWDVLMGVIGLWCAELKDTFFQLPYLPVTVTHKMNRFF